MDRVSRLALLLQLVLVARTASEDDFWSHFASSPVKSFFGEGIDDNDFEVVHPVRLDDDGMFLTHDVRYVTPVHDAKASTRRRRNADFDGFTKRTSRLLYNIQFGSKAIMLNLTENEKLLQEEFVIERIKPSNGTTRAGLASSMSRGTKWPCHFRGHVEGQPESRVALSTCHGLTGLIITEKGDYFIEPLTIARVRSEHIQRGQKAQPHKIYRRDLASVLDKAEPHLNLKKGIKDDSPRQAKDDGRPGQQKESDEEKAYSPELDVRPLFEQDFCGVRDTRRKYRRIIKKREQWEAKRERFEGARWKRSPKSGRQKRSVSVERMIEMLVVVDKKMVDYYEAYDDGNVERYVLTIINMVSELFHDASIGNSLHVSLVRLVLLEEEEEGLKISQHAENTLDSFCKWAKKINPKSDDHPNHHDVAVLLTRRDICSNSNKSCETLGLAHVAGMCQSHRSCNVNQDTGLSLAFTVAHELGHNFAMHHDGQMNECNPSSAKHNHVMAPHLTSSSLTMRWSSCSRRYITRFLDRNWGFCLNDDPAEHEQFEMPMTLPGVIYDADHQCRLMFGDNSRHCFGIDDVCHRLWCFVGGTCRSRMHAAAPGTRCAKEKWCYAGKCISAGKRPNAVDGGWGDWTEWSGCSRTCGMGVSYSMRHCDSPTPRHEGKYCTGERKRYRTCSKWKCRASNDTRSFREQQCAAFNNVKYRNMTFNWKPVESPLYPCELHCFTHAGKIPFADRLRDKVVDGTKCFPRSNDICVDGICRRVGCDKNIGSRAMEDRCGICHGDGSSCYGVKKIFSRKKGEEYSPVALLPRGARNINIEEMASASNFLALRHATNKTHYYLNGNYMIQWDTKFQLAGTQFTYRRINETLDVISSPGPLIHPVMVMLLYVEENPGVEVTYTAPYDENMAVPKEEEFPEFAWKIRDWSQCSQKCGKGHQLSVAYCNEMKAGQVEDFYCNATRRPGDIRRSCNDVPCPPRWWAAPWQPCSVTCGAGVGAQHRLVMCVRSVGEDEQINLNYTACSHLVRPTNKRRCSPTSEIPCPRWRAEEWQECSVACGGGMTNRTVQCVTYIMNDVIDLQDVGDDLLDLDLHEQPRRQKKKNSAEKDAPIVGANKKSSQRPDPPKLHGIKIANTPSEQEETLNGMGLMMSIEVDPIRYELDNELDGYDVEEDHLCDSASRPHSRKQCNTFTCPVVTSAETTDISTEMSTEELATFRQTDSTTEAEDPSTSMVESPTSPAEASIDVSTFGSTNAAEKSRQNIPAGILARNRTGDGTEPDFELTPDPVTDVDAGLEEKPSPEAETNTSGDGDGATEGVGAADLAVTTRERIISPTPAHPYTATETRPSEPVEHDLMIPAKEDFPPPAEANTESNSVVDEFDVDMPNNGDVPPLIPVHLAEKIPRIPVSEDVTKNDPTPDLYFDVYEKKEGPAVPELTNIDEFDIQEDPTKMSTTTVRPVPTSRQVQTTTTVTSSKTATRRRDRASTRRHTTPTATSSRQTTTKQAEPTSRRTTTTTAKPTRKMTLHTTDTSQSTTIRSPQITTTSPPITTTSQHTTTTSPPATTTSPPTKTTSPPITTTSLPSTTTSPPTTTTSYPTTTTATTTTTKHDTITPVPLAGVWIVGSWSECSTTCGVGAHVRQIQCSTEDESLCRSGDRPPPAKLCDLGPCAKWVYGEWTLCSRLCGVGFREKKTECVDEQSEKVLRPHHCRARPELATIRVSCRKNQCMPWKTSRWTSCSEMCGHGIQRRRTACSRYNQCDLAVKPLDKKSCFQKKCVQWKAMEWNKCSVHCGGGLQRRNVICVEEASGLSTNSTYCVSNLRPKRVRKCNVEQCAATDYDFTSCTGDRLSKRFCELLQGLGRCVQPSLAIQCCDTCKTYGNARHKDKIS